MKDSTRKGHMLHKGEHGSVYANESKEGEDIGKPYTMHLSDVAATMLAPTQVNGFYEEADESEIEFHVNFPHRFRMAEAIVLQGALYSPEGEKLDIDWGIEPAVVVMLPGLDTRYQLLNNVLATLVTPALLPTMMGIIKAAVNSRVSGVDDVPPAMSALEQMIVDSYSRTGVEISASMGNDDASGVYRAPSDEALSAMYEHGGDS